MVDEFGIWNDKERSHGALFLRPTTLSHGRVFLLMECSKEYIYPFFLYIFMRESSWGNLYMGLTFSSHMMHGRKDIDVLIDYSIEYLYFLTICKQCISP